MTIVLIILIVKKVLYSLLLRPEIPNHITNKSINHELIFYYLIYVNFRQLNLFRVAQCLLFEVARYKYIPTNLRIILLVKEGLRLCLYCS